MSATETAVYEKLRLLRVNGADFSGAMSWQDALGLMSSIDKALPDLLVGGTTGKFKILLKLIEMLQMSLQSCAQGAEECELCRARSTEQDFYRKRLGSNPLGSGDGVGEQGEDDESNEEEDELCHGLRHVPPNLRRAVLVSLWSFLLRTRTDNKTLVRQLFAELHPDSDSEEAEDPELREMVLKALDVFSIAVDVGHHEDAKKGKHAGEQFRMGSNKAQAQVRPSLLLAQGGGFVEGLKGDKALKNVLKSSRFGTVAEVGMQGQNILADSEEARVHQLRVVEHHIANKVRKPLEVVLKFDPKTKESIPSRHVRNPGAEEEGAVKGRKDPSTRIDSGRKVRLPLTSQCGFIPGNSRRIKSRNFSRFSDPCRTAVRPLPLAVIVAASVYLLPRRSTSGTYV